MSETTKTDVLLAAQEWECSPPSTDMDDAHDGAEHVRALIKLVMRYQKREKILREALQNIGNMSGPTTAGRARRRSREALTEADAI